MFKDSTIISELKDNEDHSLLETHTELDTNMELNNSEEIILPKAKKNKNKKKNVIIKDKNNLK